MTNLDDIRWYVELENTNQRTVFPDKIRSKMVMTILAQHGLLIAAKEALNLIKNYTDHDGKSGNEYRQIHEIKACELAKETLFKLGSLL